MVEAQAGACAGRPIGFAPGLEFGRNSRFFSQMFSPLLSPVGGEVGRNSRFFSQNVFSNLLSPVGGEVGSNSRFFSQMFSAIFFVP